MFIEINSINKSFKDQAGLKDINFSIARGEFVSLLGGSGCGKTLLLKIISGFLEPECGSIVVNNKEHVGLPPEKRDVSMAFQNFALYPHLSAYNNIASPLLAKKISAKVVQEKVHSIASMLSVDHVLTHLPRELSNGQKQRVGLARALIQEPSVILLDDPLRNVDAKVRFDMRLEIPKLLKKLGITLIYSTQDYKEALALSDRIIVIERGEIIQIGTPREIYNTPCNIYTAFLTGEPPINILEGTIDVSGKYVKIFEESFELPFEVRDLKGKRVQIGLRAEHIKLGKGKCKAKVQMCMPGSTLNTIELRFSNIEILASTKSSNTYSDEVSFDIDTKGLLLFENNKLIHNRSI